ncbi:MAG: hypothetical protein VKP72_14840 [bacterium]|nr:hypothetical protein [bacterium]
MSTLRQLVSRSIELLAAHPLLWTPPLATFLLPALLTAGPVYQVPLVVYIALLLSGGWLALVAAAHRGEPVQLVTFFDAIGRSALRLLVGGCSITLAAIALIAPGLLVMTRLAGGADQVRGFEKPVVAFIRSVEAGKVPDVASFDPQLVQALNWLAGCSLWVLGVTSVLLLVLQWWPHAIVLGDQGGLAAIARSWHLTRAHLGRVIAWLSVQTLLALGCMGLVGVDGFVGVLGSLGLVMVQMLFGMVFTLLYLEVSGGIEVVLEAESPTREET